MLYLVVQRGLGRRGEQGQLLGRFSGSLRHALPLRSRNGFWLLEGRGRLRKQRLAFTAVHLFLLVNPTHTQATAKEGIISTICLHAYFFIAV